MSDDPQPTDPEIFCMITEKGRWVVDRMKEIDPEVCDPLALDRRDLDGRRGLAMLQALSEWDAQHDS